MMYAEDEKHEGQAEFNTLLEKRVSALEERVIKIEVTQAEDHEEIIGLRQGLRGVNEYLLKDQQGWRWLQTGAVVLALSGWVALVWMLL